MRVRYWFGMVIVLLIGSCSGFGEADIELTGAESGGQVSLVSGDRMTVRLESNPTTGHGWAVTETGYPDGLELVETDFEEPDSDLVGVPGTQVFTIEAVSRGSGVLRFEYIRPFDDPPIPERIVEYIVIVDDAPWPPDDDGTTRSTSTESSPLG